MNDSLFPGSPVRVSLAGQIAEVQRELAMRASAYPKWVAAKSITQAQASARTASMEAVLQTLRDLARVRRALELIREYAQRDPAHADLATAMAFIATTAREGLKPAGTPPND